MYRPFPRPRGWRLLPGLAAASLAVFVIFGCERGEPQSRQQPFVKLDASGMPLVSVSEADDTSPHPCVRDQETGLVWSVEQDEPGLLHHSQTFSWFSDTALTHMSEPGLADGGDCPLDRCDTAALVEAVNAAGLCGRHDWRLPSREEAMAIGDRSRIGRGATLDPVYFPAAVPDEYWTASTFSMYPQGAWVYDARHGHDRVDWKANAKRVRLVAGPPVH
jgi:hypothetical protein